MYNLKSILRDWEYRETDNNLCLLKLAGTGLDLEASTRVKAIQLSPGSAAPGFVCDVPGWRTSESSTSVRVKYNFLFNGKLLCC